MQMTVIESAHTYIAIHCLHGMQTNTTDQQNNKQNNKNTTVTDYKYNGWYSRKTIAKEH